jgi:transcriptional regulator with XRE-family HTH domain
MLMATVRRRDVHDLEKLRRERGLTQGELASQLGVSQSHLSRVISGAAAPGTKLGFRIARLLEGNPSRKPDEWLERVRQAARLSPAFRALVTAALRMMKKR